MTPGRIGVIGLCRYMHKSHSACLCPLCVISLTHAIKDHLYGQITNLNPVRSLHSESRARRRRPAHHARASTVPTLVGPRCPPFAAMQRHEELKDFFYPGRHNHSSLLQDFSAASRGQVLITDLFTAAPCFLQQDSAAYATHKDPDIP